MAFDRHSRASRSALCLLALALLSAGCGGSGHDSRPNVLFVLADTVRQDHLSLYGYERRTTPELEALAANGWVFENQVSHASQTVPATISIMVSQYPAEHGFVHGGPGHFRRNGMPSYGTEMVFLAEVFQGAGYRTGGFVSNPFVKAKHGFAQGFDHFEDVPRWGGKLTDGFLTWLEGEPEEGSTPFFAYLHYMDAHHPYWPPEVYRDLYPRPGGGQLAYRNGLYPEMRPEDLEFTMALYDSAINLVDEQVGRLVRRLSELDLLRETIVVFTADHGDEFMEHGGTGHGTTVYGELVRVPLVIVYPPKLEPGQRVGHLTRAIDLAPTLLDLAGLKVPESFRGASLLSPAEVTFAENGPWRAAQTDEGRIVVNLENESVAVYGPDDPLDQVPLADPRLESRLRSHLRGYLDLASRRAGAGEATTVAPDADEIERLRALGYID